MKMFCYGTLKRGYGNNRYMEGCKFLGNAISLKSEFSMTGSGVPFLAKGEQKVRGELWEVTDEALPAIDQLEGHPHHYRRQMRWFVNEDTGEEVIAWVYLVEKSWHDSMPKYSGEVIEWSRERYSA